MFGMIAVAVLPKLLAVIGSNNKEGFFFQPLQSQVTSNKANIIVNESYFPVKKVALSVSKTVKFFWRSIRVMGIEHVQIEKKRISGKLINPIEHCIYGLIDPGFIHSRSVFKELEIKIKVLIKTTFRVKKRVGLNAPGHIAELFKNGRQKSLLRGYTVFD